MLCLCLAILKKRSYFNHTKFLGKTEFQKSDFNGNADFEDTEFLGETDFNQSEFRGDLDFTKVYFEGLLNMSSMKFGLGRLDINFDSINFNPVNRLTCDDATYMRLIMNFKEIGRISDANDCYFQFPIK